MLLASNMRKLIYLSISLKYNVLVIDSKGNSSNIEQLVNDIGF